MVQMHIDFISFNSVAWRWALVVGNLCWGGNLVTYFPNKNIPSSWHLNSIHVSVLIVLWSTYSIFKFLRQLIDIHACLLTQKSDLFPLLSAQLHGLEMRGWDGSYVWWHRENFLFPNFCSLILSSVNACTVHAHCYSVHKFLHHLRTSYHSTSTQRMVSVSMNRLFFICCGTSVKLWRVKEKQIKLDHSYSWWTWGCHGMVNYLTITESRKRLESIHVLRYVYHYVITGAEWREVYS